MRAKLPIALLLSCSASAPLAAQAPSGEAAAVPEGAPAAPAGEVAGAPAGDAEPVDEALLEEYRAAARILEASTDAANLLEALDALREGLPGSREVLHQLARSGVPQARCFALRALGEKGEAEKDLPVAEAALKDPDKRVRFAAGMAMRNLGPAGLEKLLEYLPGEPDPNNRKMAVKTLQHWGDKKAVPVLVRLLKDEKDRGVRNFLVTALEVLTKRRLGEDVEAWEAHVEGLALKEQAERILAEPPFQGAKKPPEVQR
ncbi:MAG: HEAT repeat domain-containing protein [Planctomycetota bacterium]